MKCLVLVVGLSVVVSPVGADDEDAREEARNQNGHHGSYREGLGSFPSRNKCQAVRAFWIAAVGNHLDGESACVEPGFELAVAHGHQVVGLGGEGECD